VRPPSDSSGSAASEGVDPREKLHDVPQAQKDHGWHGQREDKNQGKNARPGVKQYVSAHHAGYGPARTQGRKVGVQIEEHVQQTRPDSTAQIKEEVRNVPEEILDIVAEDPEKEHVSGEVQEAGMEKHAGNQGHEGYFKAGMSHQEGRETGRNRRIRKEQGIKGLAWERGLKAELVDKHNDVGQDQRDVDEGIGACWVEILERDEHGKWPGAE